MIASRRQLLVLGAAGLTATLLSGCETLEQRLIQARLPGNALPLPNLPFHSPAARLLNRAAYGPRPGDLAHVMSIGIPAYVAEQLAPEALTEEPILTLRIRSLADTLNPDTGLLFDEDDHRVVEALRQATLLRAVYSRKQLLERMVEFWTDHFNIYAFKGLGPQLKVVDDHATIRSHALGKFRDLLGASARSAAMLGYLDNTANQKGIPNENYARELMELHTLGVHGGYTQHDVREVARCFSGWTFENHWHRGRFRFDSETHDDGPKLVLGVSIPAGGGVHDGERVLDILASHPATGAHLARKLCLHFLGESTDRWTRRLAKIFCDSGGDIKPVLLALLTSDDLLTAKPILKRPLDFTVSSLRALNADTDGSLGVQGNLESMGQALFAWPMPDGFPEAAHFWTGALIPRWNFALALSGNALENTRLDLSALAEAGAKAALTPHDTLLELAFGCSSADLALAGLRTLAHGYPDLAEYTAIILMSPTFQWR